MKRLALFASSLIPLARHFSIYWSEDAIDWHVGTMAMPSEIRESKLHSNGPTVQSLYYDIVISDLTRLKRVDKLNT